MMTACDQWVLPVLTGCFLGPGPKHELSGVKLTGNDLVGPVLGEDGPVLRWFETGLTTLPTGILGLCGFTLSESAISFRTAPGDSAPVLRKWCATQICTDKQAKIRPAYKQK